MLIMLLDEIKQFQLLICTAEVPSRNKGRFQRAGILLFRMLCNDCFFLHFTASDQWLQFGELRGRQCFDFNLRRQIHTVPDHFRLFRAVFRQRQHLFRLAFQRCRQNGFYN